VLVTVNLCDWERKIVSNGSESEAGGLIDVYRMTLSRAAWVSRSEASGQ
jgi:hypothetical protein